MLGTKHEFLEEPDAVCSRMTSVLERADLSDRVGNRSGTAHHCRHEALLPRKNGTVPQPEFGNLSINRDACIYSKQ